MRRLRIYIDMADSLSVERPADVVRDRHPSNLDPIARRMAAILSQAGHDVSVRGAAPSGGAEPASHQASLGGIDVAICAQCVLSEEVTAMHRVAWSFDPAWPTDLNWSAIIAHHPSAAKTLQARLCGPVRFIRPGCEATGANPRRDRLLYQDDPDRGLLRVLKMWPELWAAFQVPLSIACNLRAHVRSHAAGSVEQAKMLRALVPLLDQPGIVVHDHLDDEALMDLHARSFASLHPSPGVPANEDTRWLAFAALAAGCPPVMLGAQGDMGEAAQAVGVDTPAGWIEAISEVRARSPHRVAGHSKMAAAWTWDHCAAAWISVLHAVVSPRPGDSEDPMESTTTPDIPSGPAPAERVSTYPLPLVP